MTIACLMPVRGRHEQTVANVRRLQQMAGHEAHWLCIVDDDLPLERALDQHGVAVIGTTTQQGYWRSLRDALAWTPTATHLVNLANDLLPGRDWLARAVEAYRAAFGDGDGMVGFNDGVHAGRQAGHFLISRALLDRYGGWPVWYRHYFGDTELNERARSDGRLVMAPWAVLYHDHPLNGGQDDATYAEGRATWNRDSALFAQRRTQGWPKQPDSNIPAATPGRLAFVGPMA